MKLTIIETGLFKLDGGAMFGVVPKTLWSRKHPSDDNNLCTWCMRCLLIETENRKILIDTGIGNKQDVKFRSHFHPHGSDSLANSLLKAGLRPEDITDVLLTHFHFDHVGGAVMKNPSGDLLPAFPNAVYWTNEAHYNWAYQPNVREKASFLKENFVPLKEQGLLRYIDVQKDDVEWLPGIKLRFVYGHTEAMMIPLLSYEGKTIVYCADLLPSNFHISLPYVMSYDVRPLNTLEEKERLLTEAIEHDYYLFFEHDPTMSCATVAKNERGRIVLKESVDFAKLVTV